MLDLIKLDLISTASLQAFVDLLNAEITNRIDGDTNIETLIDNILVDGIPFVYIGDVKSVGTDGGTFTTGAWEARDLNTVLDESGTHGITIVSDEIVLPADGFYVIRWSAPARAVGGHISRLYNVTNAIKILNGSTEYSSETSSRSEGWATVDTRTSGVPETIRIEHQCESTKATDGFGLAAIVEDELYSWIRIERFV